MGSRCASVALQQSKSEICRDLTAIRDSTEGACYGSRMLPKVTPMLRLIAYRIYLTVQVLVTIGGLLAVLAWVVVFSHDRAVVKDDFRCFDATLNAGAETLPEGLLPVFTDADEVAAADKCRLTRHRLYYSSASDSVPWSDWHSSRAWQYSWGTRQGPSFAKEDAAFFGVAIGVPIGLFVLYRWLIWLSSPPAVRVAPRGELTAEEAGDDDGASAAGR